jgi:hypothetical protein
MRGQLKVESKRHDVHTDVMSPSTVYHRSSRPVSIEYSLMAAAIQRAGYMFIHNAVSPRHIITVESAVRW